MRNQIKIGSQRELQKAAHMRIGCRHDNVLNILYEVPRYILVAILCRRFLFLLHFTNELPEAQERQIPSTIYKTVTKGAEFGVRFCAI